MLLLVDIVNYLREDRNFSLQLFSNAYKTVVS